MFCITLKHHFWEPEVEVILSVIVEAKILIKSSHLSKGYNISRLLAEFPDKGWTKRSINRLFQKLRKTGSVDRRVGSGRPRSARTEENIDLVDDLIVSQEDKPQTHKTVREIAAQQP